MMGRPLPEQSGTPCAPCVEYRRGERDNLTYAGVNVHVCEHKREGTWNWDACPCGCKWRDPGVLDTDRALYGNAFIGPHGERIDPTTVHPA